MLAVILGLSVAATYGSADFLGGLSAKRSAATAVLVCSQASALVVLAILVPLLPGHPQPGDLVRGSVAGLVGAVGVALLYRGLASGRMAIVAPITAVGAAVVPVLVGRFTGDDVPAVAVVGIALALAGVVLVAQEAGAPGSTGGRTTMAELVPAVASGICFGGVFALLSHTTAGSGLWPILAQRATSVSVVGLIGLAGAYAVRPTAGAWRTIVPAGLLDAGANGLFLAASRVGDRSIAAVLGALYPAATVLLARVVLAERMNRLQVAGLAVAGCGVALLSLG